MKLPSDLDIAFLNKVLEKMREMPLNGHMPTSHTFYECLPAQHKDDERKTRLYVKAHLEHLRDIGLLELDAKTIEGTYHIVKLTADGRHFVQPELAQFYGAVTAQLVSALEAEIDSSSLSEDEKHTFKYRLKEAIANYGADVAVKFIVEILKRVAAGT